MPIPAAADAPGTNDAGVVLALFRQLHAEIRQEIADMDGESLGWVPTPGANSISTIVIHIVGSEAETLRSVAGLPGARDREAEFTDRSRTNGELLALLGDADELVDTVDSLLDADRLRSAIALPTLPADEVRTGAAWLIANYGHAREHLGHIQLTRQLYDEHR